jgi:uncharacterized protein VirK/YbjX
LVNQKLGRRVVLLLLLKQAQRRRERGGNLSEFVRQVVFAVFNLSTTTAWVNLRQGRSLLRELQHSSTMVGAMSKAYINDGWRVNQRLHSIADHYEFCDLKKDAIFSIAEGHYIECDVPATSDFHMRLLVDRPAWMRSEGQLAVSLFVGVDRVYCLAFSVNRSNGAHALVIGAIQGARLENVSEIYRECTKQTFGMRPRDLLVFIAQLIASRIGCSHILAIADNHHQTRNKSNQDDKVASYDELWEEHLGVRQSDGFYRLPVEVRRRAAEDVPAKKRSQYRQRYSFLETVDATIGNKLLGTDVTYKKH